MDSIIKSTVITAVTTHDIPEPDSEILVEGMVSYPELSVIFSAGDEDSISIDDILQISEVAPWCRYVRCVRSASAIIARWMSHVNVEFFF